MSRLARIAVSICMIAAIVWYAGGPSAIARSLAQADLRWLAASFAALTFDRWLMTFKWSRLLRSRGVALPVLDGLKIYCASMMWGLFLPSTLGADAVRTYFSARRGLPTPTVVASIVVERMAGFIASVLVGLLGLAYLASHDLLEPRFSRLIRAGLLLLAAACGAFGLSLNRRLLERAHGWLASRLRDSAPARRALHLHRSYAGFGASRAALGRFFALTLLEQLLLIFCIWLNARAVGVDLGLPFMTAALSLTLLLSRLPISIAGIGVFDGAFVALLGLVAVPAAQAVSISLVGWVVQIASWLPWWLAQGLERPPPSRPGAAPSSGSAPDAQREVLLPLRR